jgi:predicted nucleic acid-binding Zn ribbon protein
MGDVLNVLLARRGYAQVQAAAACARAWEAAAGAEFARRTRAGQVRRGVLEVMVSSSTVLQELSFRKKELIRRLGELAPAHQIRDLRFRVGEVE